MKKTILMLLVLTIPLFTFAQKRSKKGKSSKNDKEMMSKTIAPYEFMIIKGAELNITNNEDIDPTSETDDVSLERDLKRLLSPPVRLVVSFDVGSMRGPEITELMKKSNEFRTMASAVTAASKYGWEFMNANVVSSEKGMVHYYYMRRKN